jgi:tetratricopeptide (TPR) repeat protein
MPARSQEVTTGPSSGDIPSLIQEAKDRLNRGDPDGALQAYEAVIAKDPKNIVALYFAGNLNLQLHKIVPGLTLLSRAAALAPTDPRLWLLLGKAYEQYATTEDALRAYKHVEEIAPGSPQAKDADKRLRLLSGKKMLSLGSPKQAQAIFSSLLKDYPNDSALQNEVNALNRPPEQTASTLKGELSPEKQAEASRLASSDIPSLIQEAKSRLNRHDPEGALQAYEAVIAKDPNNIVALYFAGNLNLQLKKIVPGLTLLSRAATLAPTDPKLWLLLGKAYEQYATIEDALRVYRHVQEIAPGTPQAQEADKRLRLLSGKKLLSLGSTKQAQEIFSNLLNDYPKDPAVLTEIKALNQAREQTRSHVTSELTPEKLEEAAKQMSGDIPTLLTEGRKFVANNDPKNALKTYEAVLSKDSNNIEALFFAGNLYLASNQPEPGLKYLARAVSILPKNVKLRMALAEAYERFNHTEDARREYQDVIGLSGKTNEGKEANKKFQLLSGKLALSQGQADQALEIFSRLKDDYPNDPEVLSEIEAANRAKNLTQGPGEGGKGIAPGLAPSIEVASLMADAKTRLAKNDIKGALAIFEEILAKDPNNFEALYFAGNINLQLKNPKQGLTYLTKCISVAPNNLRLRLFVAQSYERYNFLGDALREYGNIVGLGIATPEGQEANKRFQFLSGLRALHQGDADQSLVVFKGLLQEYPSDTAALTGIVNAYIAAKKIDYAKNLLEWIVAHNPYDAAAHFYLAGFYERLGNLLQAIDQYSIVLRQIPRDAPEFREANLKIATIKGQLALQSNDFSDAKHSYEQLL